MERLLLLIAVIGIIALNSWPLVAGWIAAPANFQFLGAIHHPQDYYYYLSQLTQGAGGRWLTAFDLYTGEFRQATLVGWTNVLIGRLGGLVGLTPILTYHLSLILFGLVMFILAYRLVKIFFPATQLGRTQSRISLILFALGNSFPQLITGPEGTQVTYSDFWFNFGKPFNRVGQVPHQTLVTAATITLFWLGLQPGKLKPAIRYLILAAAALVLSSIHPVQWLTAVISLSLALLISYINKRSRVTDFWSPAVIGISGLLPAVYLKNLFGQLPYSQLAAWESWQQLPLTVLEFILNGGPVVVLAAIGLPLFLKTKSPARWTAVISLIISLAALFTPFPAKLHLGNVRFTSPLMYLFLALAASETIISLGKIFRPSPRAATWIITVVILSISIPVYAVQMRTRTSWDTNNAYLFLSNEAIQAFTATQKLTGTDDLVFVAWPFNVTFPAVTGRRVFSGHDLLTINSPQKNDLTWKFFSSLLPPNEMSDLVRQSRITHVLTYPWTFRPVPDYFRQIWSNNLLTLYKVTHP